jgi:hypothetical protein
MFERFQSVISSLFQAEKDTDTFCIFDPVPHLDREGHGEAGVAAALNAAFLSTLAGRGHPAYGRARELLSRLENSPRWTDVAAFYRLGLQAIPREIEENYREDSWFAERLDTLYRWISEESNLRDPEESTERIWSLFFPEAVGIRAHWQERTEALRTKRTVTITETNPYPIVDPARQILFTSNVLLGLPPASKSLEEWHIDDDLKDEVRAVAGEPQLYWYDHPIQIGVEPEANEVLYGLRGLDTALEYERNRGNLTEDARLTCVLSVSTTHRGLQPLAKRYLEREFARSGGLRNLEVFIFTEVEARRLVDEILAPAGRRYLGQENAGELLSMFGVDGEYGRHYSFLKAIAAFWSVFIRPEVTATFKIDLDQVFPQRELVEETGHSAFEHFTTPLWGARGVGADGQPLELGMIAGALVNERDIERSIYTPDVRFPDRGISPDEHIFFSGLPQALSTEAEMMARYSPDGLDGKNSCLQRVHVTGGTNGILVDSLRRYRPFTPSFIGRAEDQAYLLSVLPHSGPRLAYLHKDGLIMRHDKEAFAQTAIQSARVGTLVGDYLRILNFSAYARVLAGDVMRVKEIFDPFTGCFISRIPTTVAYLRFGLKAASLFSTGMEEQGLEFVTLGALRIPKALEFVGGEDSPLRRCYEKERAGWNLYYDILAAVEDALSGHDDFAQALRLKAKALVERCSVCAEKM